ncbi:MAG: amidohydrolase family protein [Acidobacteria bacterium]|nr:amidohydrolase family protein [Acidobacteriota bacterium]
MVLYNGKVLTADHPDPAQFPIAEAVAVFGGRIVGVGASQEILKMAGPQTRRIDLAGRTMIPGRIDSHSHLQNSGARRYLGYGGMTRRANVGMAAGVMWTNKEEGLAQVRTVVQSKPPGELVVIQPTFPEETGWNQYLDTFSDEFFNSITLADLDRVAPRNPLNLATYAMHHGMANSLALKILLDRYPNTPGIDRDSSGKPTGAIHGVAQRHLGLSYWPQEDPAWMAEGYLKHAQDFHFIGTTTVSTRMERQPLRAYQYLDERGEMNLRIAYATEAVLDHPDPEEIIRRYDTAAGEGSPMLWTTGFSVGNVDSVNGNAGVCYSKPYPREALNFPLWRYQVFGPNGACYIESKDFNYAKMFDLVIRFGGRVAGGHIAGDRSLDKYMDILEPLAEEYNIPEKRFGADHCVGHRPDQIPRAAKLNIFFSCSSPIGANEDGTELDAQEIIFGPEVGAEMRTPFRSMIDAGLKPSLESSGYTFLLMEQAITRKYPNGRVRAPGQRINRREALYTVTQWPAMYTLREKEIGSIGVGTWADLVVLDKDYLTIPEDDINNIDVLMTILGGKIVYTEPGYATANNLPQVGFRGDPRTFNRGRPGEGSSGGGG